MSEKEKVLVKKMSQFPPELQDKFAAAVDGAVMALDVMAAEKKKKEG